MSDLNTLKPHIGKRIYIVDVNKMVVVPAVVNEKVIRETAGGIETSYMLNFGIEGSENVSSFAVKDQHIVGTSAEAFEVLKRHIDALVKAWQESKVIEARNIVSNAVSNGDSRFGPERQPIVVPESPRDVVDGLHVLGGVTGTHMGGTPTTSRGSSQESAESEIQQITRQKRQKITVKNEEKVDTTSAE